MPKEPSKNNPQSGYDITLLFSVLFLVGLGVVMVYSASSALALKKFGVDYYYFKKQIFFSFLGILVLVASRHIPLKLFYSMAYPLIIFAFLLLIAVKVSGFGVSAGGSTRWLRLGFFTFQPSELARFSLVLYLAYSMSKKSDKLKDFSIGFMPHIIVFGIFAILIFVQPDFGSVVILGAITWMMLFVGGVRILHLVTPLLILLPALYIFMINAPYRFKRILSFLDPWKYPTDEGYQMIHSFMAFGTGGIWGTGIGKSYQKLFYLPEPHTDFIFSVIGEELGLFGVFVILSLYCVILWRGIIIAKNAEEPFTSFMAIGLTIAIGLQVCINMGVVMGLLPTKGLTLPFLSYGGTSLLINMASIGVLLNIGASTHAFKPKERASNK